VTQLIEKVGPREDATVTVYPCRYGSFAHYTSDEGIGLFLQLYGEWAEAELALLRQFIPVGGTVLDLGANIGTHTLAFAQFVGAGGLVVAVEGQPAVHKVLTYNVVRNGATDIVCPLNAIVGSSVGLVQYATGTSRNVKNYGLAQFRDATSTGVGGDAADAGGIEIQLPTITVDSLNLKKCDLIKIDVEGMELNVIKGAMKTLSSLSPIVYFEQSPGYTVDFAALYDLLHGLGYKLYWHVANPYNQCNFRGSPVNIFGGAVEVNVLACPSRMSTVDELPEVAGPNYDPAIPSRSDSVKGVCLPVNESIAAGFDRPIEWKSFTKRNQFWTRMKDKVKEYLPKLNL
jgi:FkbM family methyltransferase